MKIKADFVTNSSSTSFTFIFEGTKRTDLFKKLVKYESHFSIKYSTWNKESFDFDVWDLIDNLISLIKKGVNDRYYLPDIYPLTKVKEDVERDLKNNKRWLKEESSPKSSINKSTTDYIIRHYKEQIKIKTKDLVTLDKYINCGKAFSAVEITFGNDGMVTGNFGDAMETEIKNFKKEDDFHIIIESRH